jgi:integrase
VRTALKAVSSVHQWRGYASPTKHPEIWAALQDYATRWEAAGYRPDVAHRLTPDQSVAMARSNDLTTVNGLRIACLTRLQFDIGARESEIVALNVEDLEWLDEDRVRVTIKTSSGGGPRTVLVEGIREVDWDVDPYRLLRQWVDVLIDAGYPTGAIAREVFNGMPRLDGAMAGSIRAGRMSTVAYSAAHRRAARRAGFVDADGQPLHITTHSERAGHIEAADGAGVPVDQVAHRTGHSLASDVIHGYFDRPEHSGDANAGTAIRRARRPAPDQP